MSLTDARAELEQQGFSVTDEDGGLVAVRSKWHWDTMFTKLDFMVFVTEVSTLTLEKLEEDLAGLDARVKAHAVGGFPPVGFQRASLVVPIYLTETIEEEALARIVKEPPMQFGRAQFLAARDGEGTHFLEKSPLWGWIFFDKLRHLASRVTGRAAPEQAPTSVGGAILSISVMLLLGYVLLNVVLIVVVLVFVFLMMFLGVVSSLLLA